MFRATEILHPLIQGLPGTDARLFGYTEIEAWRTLRDGEVGVYAQYIRRVRARRGPHFTDLLEARIGAAPSAGIALLSPVHVLQRRHEPMLVHRLLPSRGIIVVYGDAGAAKTSLGLYLGLSIALGRRAHQLRVRQGGLLYISTEGSMKPRLAAYEKKYGVALADAPVRFVEQPVLLNGGDLDELIAAARASRETVGAYALVVVDTLARTFTGSESDGADMAKYIDGLGRIGEALECAVLVIHHAGKNAALGARGHSSLRAAADVEIEVTRTGDARTARVTKSRDGIDGQQFPFALEVVDLGPSPDPEAEDGERLTGCVVVPTDAITPTPMHTARRLPPGAVVALDALRTALRLHGEPMPGSSVVPAGVMAVLAEQWQEAYSAQRPIAKDGPDAKRERNARRMAFQRAQDQLQAARAVETWNGRWWIK